jgi:diguanylate cyclase (GGDEF)-like protein
MQNGQNLSLRCTQVFSKTYRAAKDFFSASVPDCHKDDFFESVNRTNLFRAKIIAAAFVFLEMLLLLYSYLVDGNRFLKGIEFYYVAMYAAMFTVMIIFLIIFINLSKNIRKNKKRIDIAGILFAAVILFWSGGISLLDQRTTGQIIVYTVAVICVAVTPIYNPLVLLATYFFVNMTFVTLLPHFTQHGEHLFGNTVNATAFVVISWCISMMRYHGYVHTFNNSKIIEQKSEELERINIELEEANRKLQKLSQRDGLTGIYNRFMFDRTIESEWDRCRRQFCPLAFMMIDIDYFKLYNDRYGHPAGDECLKRVAELLLRSLKRSSDTVARYGGEEFAVILPCTEIDGAAALAEHIREDVEQLAIMHASSKISDYVTVSIGVNSVTPSAALSIDDLIAGADKALYLAKRRRNAIVVV